MLQLTQQLGTCILFEHADAVHRPDLVSHPYLARSVCRSICRQAHTAGRHRMHERQAASRPLITSRHLCDHLLPASVTKIKRRQTAGGRQHAMVYQELDR